MTRTIIDNTRSAARLLAKDTGLSHQQALDAIARERGHRHWTSFRTLPVDVADLMMLSHLDHAWRRRASALRFDYGEEGVTASLTFPGRSKPCEGHRHGSDETRRLRRAMLNRFDHDVSQGGCVKQMTIRLDIGISDKEVQVPVTLSTEGDGKRGSVIIAFDEHAGCDWRDASQWQAVIADEESGLLLVQGDAGERRGALASAVTQWLNARGGKAYAHSGHEDRHLMAETRDAFVVMEVPHDVPDWVARDEVGVIPVPSG